MALVYRVVDGCDLSQSNTPSSEYGSDPITANERRSTGTQHLVIQPTVSVHYQVEFISQLKQRMYSSNHMSRASQKDPKRRSHANYLPRLLHRLGCGSCTQSSNSIEAYTIYDVTYHVQLVHNSYSKVHDE